MEQCVVYFAFANNPSHPLPNLEQEAGNLRSAFRPRQEQRLIQVEVDEFATLPKMEEVIRTFRNRICLFHYAGHAGSQSLLFSDGLNADSTGIANLLGEQENLHLVFLNGCSTEKQVERLKKLGIPVVIYTTVEIGDALAKGICGAFIWH
ncbi:MAG: hypothetical protein IPN20_03700 [Haliscomenobacter sp.]|nr:hypothetical protein [Haliscomenobacter sp.]